MQLHDLTIRELQTTIEQCQARALYYDHAEGKNWWREEALREANEAFLEAAKAELAVRALAAVD